MLKTRVDAINLLDEMYYTISSKFKGKKDFWPSSRIETGYVLYFIIADKISSDAKKRKLIYKKTNYTFSDFRFLLKQKINIYRLKKKFVNGLKGQVLLFGYTDNYYNNNNQFINSYLSPFKIELDKKLIKNHEFLFTNKQPLDEKRSEFMDLYTLLYEYYKNLWKLKNIYKHSNKRAFHNATLVDNFLSSKNIKEHGHIANNVYKSEIEFEIKTKTFIHFLKIVNPKCIWAYCYYDNTTMALLKAANTLNINNAEYQHSIQPDEHFGYGKWPEIDSYKNCFPENFWVWQQSDKDRLIRNFSGNKYQPNVICGGNIYSIQQKEAIVSQQSENLAKGILICLQGSWIPEYLEKIIEEDQEYVWYFRLHPRYSEDKLQLTKLLEKIPKKVNMDDANSLSLFELFRKVNTLITPSSGAALESKGFAIKVIITDGFGLSAYKTEIEEGEFYYCTDKETMVDLLYVKSNDIINVGKSIVFERQRLNDGLNYLLG